MRRDGFGEPVGRGSRPLTPRWFPFTPALALILLALSINLLGDWLRDVLNPRLR